MRNHITADIFNQLTIEERDKLFNYFRFSGYAVYAEIEDIQPLNVLEINSDRKTVFQFPRIDPRAKIPNMSFEEVILLINLSPL